MTTIEHNNSHSSKHTTYDIQHNPWIHIFTYSHIHVFTYSHVDLRHLVKTVQHELDEVVQVLATVVEAALFHRRGFELVAVPAVILLSRYCKVGYQYIGYILC